MRLQWPNNSKSTAALRICRSLADAGHRALLAGGCVRDLLIQHVPQDYDIATSALPGEVAAIFPRTVGVGASFGVQKVLDPDGEFEVATFRKDGPYHDGRHPSRVEFTDEAHDAQRRDFTINALFYDPLAEKVLDYVDGRRDIELKVIRTVGDPEQRFAEDYLRLIRAVRFAARLEYRIDAKTMSAICHLAPNILKVSVERIRDELLKILTEGHPKRGFELLDETGLLARVLPEVAQMKGVPQPPEYHPEGDVFAHTLLVLEHLDNPTATVALAALLHDVGKPLTITFEDRIRFNSHDSVGADVAYKICKRLHLSRAETERVVWIVKQHMRLAVARDMKESKLKRFIREPGLEELIEVGRADAMGSHGNAAHIDWIENYAANMAPEAVHPPPLLTGNDLIELGYAPGPLFGGILRAVEDAQLENRLQNKEEARRYVVENWPA